MTILRAVLVIIIGFLLCVLALQNYSELTNVKLFHRYYGNVSLSIVMLYAFAFGLLTVGVFAVIDEIRLRTRLRKEKKEKDALYEELKALRNLALDWEEKKEQQ